MHIELVPGTECPEDIRSLFTEYTRMLVSECPGFARYLEMQDFDSELLNLDKKYSPPEGRLYAVFVDGAAAALCPVLSGFVQKSRMAARTSSTSGGGSLA